MFAVVLLLLVCGVVGSEGGLPPREVDLGQGGGEAALECPPGVPVAMCLGNPCDLYSCDVPNVHCTPNFCGGCYARWEDAQGNVVLCEGSADQ